MLNIPIISIIISCLLDNNMDVVRRNYMLITSGSLRVN